MKRILIIIFLINVLPQYIKSQSYNSLTVEIIFIDSIINSISMEIIYSVKIINHTQKKQKLYIEYIDSKFENDGISSIPLCLLAENNHHRYLNVLRHPNFVKLKPGKSFQQLRKVDLSKLCWQNVIIPDSSKINISASYHAIKESCFYSSKKYPVTWE